MMDKKMTKAREFFEKSKDLNTQVWDVMVEQAIAFSQGKKLEASYNSQKVRLLEIDLQKLRSDIKTTYGFIPGSLQDYYNATLDMIKDIRSGALLLSKNDE